VVEELLEGPEISVLAFSDGYTIIPLPAAQDHKRIGEGDTGLNTGGMGAYAPAPVATPAIMAQIMKESLQPTISGMRRDGACPLSIKCRKLNAQHRLPICWDAVHWLYANLFGPQSTRV
jgi:hypothetical protein